MRADSISNNSSHPNINVGKRNTDDALLQSESRLFALTSATSDVVYRMSPDWACMYQLDGRNFLEDTGEASDNWLEKYIYPEDHQFVLEAIDQAIRTRSTFELEHRVVRADGTLGWTLSRAVPVLGPNDEIVEWFGLASDVTERKNSEEELRRTREESEKRKRIYEAITSSTPDLIYIFDLNYRFVYANAALLTMWGRTWEQSIGLGLLELGYEPWHAEMHEREIDQVIATKKGIRGEVSFPHATLGRRIYDYIFVPVLDEKGEVEAIVGTTRDITEIKRAEEARTTILNQLEKRVNERTHELHRSNEDLQQFAHVASHDLKEPVRKIKTYANRLKDEFDTIQPDRIQAYIDRILGSAERMSQMIDGVLRYSAPDGIEEKVAVVDLNQIIEEIQNDLELAITQKKVVIRASSLPRIEGISVLLHQLFYNLINNAIKFSRAERSPEIEIVASNFSVQGAPFTSIEVRDNGIGFDQEYHDKIFETFTRLNPRHEYDGTGLGLSLCRKIVERHHGTIEASGAVNQGAIFTIKLPLHQK